MSNRHLDPSWMFSERGIRGHFSDMREAEAARHREASKQLDDTENQMLDALAKFNASNNIFTLSSLGMQPLEDYKGYLIGRDPEKDTYGAWRPNDGEQLSVGWKTVTDLCAWIDREIAAGRA